MVTAVDRPTSSESTRQLAQPATTPPARHDPWVWRERNDPPDTDDGVVLGTAGMIESRHNEKHKHEAVKELAARDIVAKLDGKEAKATAGVVFTSSGAVVPVASLCIAGGCSRRWPRCWFLVTCRALSAAAAAEPGRSAARAG